MISMFSLSAGPINFNAQSSTVRASNGSIINIRNTFTNNGGTLSFVNQGMFQGSPNAFINSTGGIFDNNANPLMLNTNFNGVTDISLTSKTPISGTWVFTGTNILNGNGNIIDLTDGGKFVLASGARLYLSDVNVKGFNANSIIFTDNSSQVRFADVQLYLTSNVSFTTGGIYVESPSTINLNGYYMNLSQAASLTVDGTILWLGNPTVDFLGTTSNLNTPYPVLLTDTTAAYNNVAVDIASGMLSLINSGTILGVGTFPFPVYNANEYQEELLTSGPLTMDTVISGDILIPIGERIYVAESLTLSGRGATITFSDTGNAQLIVAAGKTLTLQDANLKALKGVTICLNQASSINIEAGVFFEFDEDWTFSSGSIAVANQAQGNVFNWRGRGMQHRITIQSPASIALNLNTLALYNLELVGETNITTNSAIINKLTVVGAVGLMGNGASIITKDSRMNYVVEGEDNQLRLYANSLNLNGSLTFGDRTVNDLTLTVSPPNIAQALQVNFGNNFANVSSSYGKARLRFDNLTAGVSNSGANSFVLGRGGVLGGNTINILSNPIVQVDTSAYIERFTNIVSNLSNALIQNITPPPVPHSPPSWCRFTAVHLKNIPDRTKELPTRQFDASYLSYNSQYVDNIVQLSKASGTVLLDGSLANNFGIDSSVPLNLIMRNGAIARQGSGGNLLKANDTITVYGDDNLIEVTGTLNISGQIIVSEGANLTIQLSDQYVNPILNLNTGTPIVLQAGAKLTISGAGLVQTAARSTVTVKFTPGTGIYSNSILEFNQALLNPGVGSIVTMSGSGSFVCSDGGGIHMSNPGQCLFGSKTQDIFAVSIRTGGKFLIESTAVSGNDYLNVSNANSGRVCFTKGRYSIELVDSGMIQISQGGILELNSINDVYTNGTLTTFNIDHNGLLQIDNGGILNIGQNSAPFVWGSVGGSIQGGGLIRYLNKTAALSSITQTSKSGPPFSGFLSTNTALLSFNNSVTDAQTLFKQLVQLSSLLNVSVYYVNQFGSPALITMNNVLIALSSGDQVLSDVSSGPNAGNIVVSSAVGNNLTIRRTYNAQGALISTSK